MHSQLVESLKNLVRMNLALKCAVLLWKCTAETLAKPSKRCVSSLLAHLELSRANL
jgi:hypothetical protein